MSGPKKNKHVALTKSEQAEAERLRAVAEPQRKAIGMSQEQVSLAMGATTQGAYWQIINGRVRFTNERLMRLAYILDFDPTAVRPDVFEGLALPENVVPPDLNEIWQDLSHQERAIALENFRALKRLRDARRRPK